MLKPRIPQQTGVIISRKPGHTSFQWDMWSDDIITKDREKGHVCYTLVGEKRRVGLVTVMLRMALAGTPAEIEFQPVKGGQYPEERQSVARMKWAQAFPPDIPFDENAHVMMLFFPVIWDGSEEEIGDTIRTAVEDVIKTLYEAEDKKNAGNP